MISTRLFIVSITMMGLALLIPDKKTAKKEPLARVRDFQYRRFVVGVGSGLVGGGAMKPKMFDTLVLLAALSATLVSWWVMFTLGHPTAVWFVDLVGRIAQ